MTALVPDPHRELVELISAQQRTEVQCCQYLKHARGLLMDQSGHEVLREEAQYRGNSGDADYILICRVKDGLGGEAVKAYVWEAKAPQVYLFDADTNNRVCPSVEYISAENQLLHYYDEIKGSAQFRSEYGIASADDVKLGGIVMGCSRTRVNHKNQYDDFTLNKLFYRAVHLRERHLYGNSGIKLLTWDRVAEYIKGGDAPAPSNVGSVQPISIVLPKVTVVTSS